MKAIETVYNGYKFRSRLEARWAVFFDTLGIEWQYEVEGFDLDGIWYLPDFYFPKSNFWLEIKPTFPISLEEQNKVALFNKAKEPIIANDKSISCTSKKIGIACGTPWFPKLSIGENGLEILDGYIILIPNPLMNYWSVECFKGSKNTWDIWPIYFTKDFNGTINLKDCYPFSEGEAYRSLCLPYQWMWRGYIGDGDSYSTPDLTKAYKFARQSRFEHGQNGAR